MRLTTLLVLLALIAAFDSASAQTLRGVVVTANDVPLPRVRVAVTGATVTDPAVLTDERGEFTVRVPATASASVQLTFTKARYATTVVDVRPGDGRLTEGVRVRLSLGGAISGQIRDRSGNPVIEASVTARRLAPTASSGPSVLSATTNDLGEFRFGGLVAGAYAIGARAAAQFNTPQFGASLLEEQTVNVSLSAEISGIDLAIDVPSELTGRSAVKAISDPLTTGAVRGRVVTAAGAPISGAVVQAYGPNSALATPAVETDARGRFVIDRLAPGNYRVRAFKRGFIAPSVGARSAVELLLGNEASEGQFIRVAREQTVDAIDLILGRGASISGTIVDEFGEPLQDVAVSILELRLVAGRNRALRVATGRGSFGRTDDRGRYRLFGLQPGTYIVQATAGNVISATTGYVPTFYPSTPIIDFATPTNVGPDASVAGVDLSLQPQPTRRIRGTVFTPAGNPATPAQVTLSRRGSAIQMDASRAITDANGMFAFNNIPPGDYVVQAMTTDRTGPSSSVAVARQLAEAFVTVAGDEPPLLQLRLSLGATLIGRVVFEGITAPPRSSVDLTTMPAELDGDPIIGATSIGFTLLADNTFEYRGVFGRSFLIAQPKDPSWYVKSITYQGRDLADTPFDFGSTDVFRDIEVVVSSGGAVLTGRVTDDRAAAVRDYTVALIPTDRTKLTLRSRWLRTGRPTQDGAFRLVGLVPGEYWIAAVDRLDGSEIAGDLQNPDILDALASRATRITLGEGQQQDLTLRLVRR